MYINVKDILFQIISGTSINITFQMLKFISFFFLSPQGLLPEPSAFLPHLDWVPLDSRLSPGFLLVYSVSEPMCPLPTSQDHDVGPRFAGAHHEKDTGVVKIRILEL